MRMSTVISQECFICCNTSISFIKRLKHAIENYVQNVNNKHGIAIVAVIVFTQFHYALSLSDFAYITYFSPA